MDDQAYYATGTLRADEPPAADEDAPPQLRVSGTAVDYDRVAYFSPRDRVALKPGSAAANLAKRQDSSQRDVLALLGHDPARVVGRTGNGSLRFSDTPAGLMYELDLDPADPESASVYAKVKNGNLSAASIGFIVKDAEDAKLADNSPDAKEPGAEVDVEYASEVDVFEVSLVAHGAMGGATALAASAMVEGMITVDEDTASADTALESEAEAPPEPSLADDSPTWGEAAEEWHRAGIFNRGTLIGG